MAFAGLIENGLHCRFWAYYQVSPELYAACLVHMPAYADCLLCLAHHTTNEILTALFIPQGQPFAELADAEGYTVSMVFFSTEIEGIPAFSYYDLKILRIQHEPVLLSLVLSLGHEAKNSFIFKDNIQAATLKKICLYLLRDLYQQRKELFDKINIYFSNERLLKILAHLHKNINSSFSLQGFSKMIYLSPVYVSQFFKKNVGTSIQAYLIDQRVKLALHDLVSTSLPLAAIAEQRGFIDQAYFNRRFKALYGINPSYLRKNYQLLMVSQAGEKISKDYVLQSIPAPA